MLADTRWKSTEGGWEAKVRGLQDADLAALAVEIPTALRASHADNTNKSYSYIAKKWTDWALGFVEICVMPANPFYLALYGIHLSKTATSNSVLKSLIPAVSWAHRQKGFVFDCDDFFLRDTMSGLIRLLAKPKQPKDALTVEQLKTVADSVKYHDVGDLRVVCMIMLAFCGFLRFAELANIKRSDLQFFGWYMKINITKSKTDQLRNGRSVLISRLDKGYCPVALTQIYLVMVGINDNDSCYIFRNLAVSNGVVTGLRKADKPMLYTTARQVVKAKFASLDIDTSNLGLHSLRSGGATAAVRNGVPERLLQRHGRWSSEACKNMYIEDSQSQLLSVTQNLGL